MVTNGSLITSNIAKKIRNANLKSVTISLDSLDENVFEKTVEVKGAFSKVVAGLENLKKEGVQAKINTVLTTNNIESLSEIIKFCTNNQLSLKLLDYISYNRDDHNKLFVPLSSIKPLLAELSSSKTVQYQDEGYGTPEEVYTIDGIKVVVKDSQKGTCYSSICDVCDHFPCQSGIVSMLLTSDGFLKLCGTSNKHNVDVKPLIFSDETTKQQVFQMIQLYNTARFNAKGLL